ncbi:H(+)/Cl(-) exchange transporter ClcA [Roseibium algae]|uniref:H(+)/Cl(-) exchange transporter ClcA n=1 Tax=Roseibium algae TaxID=3123038 RepID=A0ABU8TEQ5_9HYPH
MRDYSYFIKAIAIGLIVGLIGTAFHQSADWIAWAYRDLRHALPGIGWSLAASMLISASGTLAALYLVRRFAPETAGSGIQEIEGAMEDLRPLNWGRVLIIKFTGGLLALGSGLVLGREGPTIHMGAAAAEAISLKTGQSGDNRKGLLAAGAAAGLAAAFYAPLAAILFIIEETRRQFPHSYRTYMAVILASLSSAVVIGTLVGTTPSLGIQVAELPVWTYTIFPVLGVSLGLLGVGFNKALITAMDAMQRVPAHLWWTPALVVGAITGALLIVFPKATHGGEDLVRLLTESSPGIVVLLLLTVLRFASVLFSYALGVPGGIFAPMLSIATCAGLAFGGVATELLPETNGLQRACAIAAMGGFFAASVRAPMVGIVLVLELTGAYQLLMPVLITCASASITAHQLGGRPIYETLLDRTLRLSGKKVPVEPPRTPIQLGTSDE